MSISYQGIGEWCATLRCGAGVCEDAVVGIGASGTAVECGAGDDFCGVVRAIAHDGRACSVQLGGLATVCYSGEETPRSGFGRLAADGVGGVCVSAEKGREYLILDVDSTEKTVVIKL